LPIRETLGYTPEVWTDHVCRAILSAAIGYQQIQDIIMAGDPFAGPVPAFLLPEEQAREDAMTRQLQEVLGDDIEIAPPYGWRARQRWGPLAQMVGHGLSCVGDGAL
jgi:hypothetical protein